MQNVVFVTKTILQFGCWLCKARLQIGLMYDVQFLICRNVDKKFQTNKLFLRVYHSEIYLFGETQNQLFSFYKRK